MPFLSSVVIVLLFLVAFAFFIPLKGIAPGYIIVRTNRLLKTLIYSYVVL